MGENALLELIIKAKDEATATLTGVGKTIDDTAKKAGDFSKTMKLAGGILTGVGVAGVVAMADWAKSAGEAQVEMASVNAILKNVSDATQKSTVVIGGNAGAIKGQTKEIENQLKQKATQLAMLKLSDGDHKAEIATIQKSINALKLQGLQIESTTVIKGKAITVINKHAQSLEQLQKATADASNAYIKLGFDDETTAMSFAKLYQSTMDAKKANEFLALSADLARYKGVDLETATIAIMKASQGSTKELKAMGLAVNDGATAQQNLATIQKTVSGQAVAYSKTYKGAMDTMNVTISNLKENLGDRLLPTITQFIGKLSDIVQKINDLNPNIIDMAVKIVAIGTGIALVVGPILMLIGFLPALSAGFALLSTTMLPVIAVIGAVALGAFLIITNWQKLQPMLQPVLDFIMNLFGQIKTGIMDFVNNNIPTFMAIWETLVGVLDVGLAFISGIWNAVWPAIQQVFIGVWGMIKGTFEIIWGAMQVILAVGLGIFTGKWSEAWNLMKTGFHNIFDGIATYFSGWWTAIKGMFKTGIDSIIGFLNGFVNVINKVGGKMGLNVNIPNIPSFDNGGWVNNTGLAMVHQGEFVMSKDMLAGKQSTPNIVNNRSNPITINLVANTPVDLDMLNYKLAFALRNGNY